MGVWLDPYHTPTVARAMEVLSPEARTVTNEIVKLIAAKPRPVWVVPWGWVLACEQGEAPVFLLPRPEGLIVAARIARSRLEEEGVERLLRGTLVNTSCVGDWVWIEWRAESAKSFSELVGLAGPG